MGEDLKWLIGIALTISLAFSGVIVGTFRNLNNKISKNTSDVHKKIDTNTTETNAKIDNVKEKYVRRDDLNGHLEHVDTRIKELRDEQRENHKQVIALLRDKNN